MLFPYKNSLKYTVRYSKNRQNSGEFIEAPHVHSRIHS